MKLNIRILGFVLLGYGIGASTSAFAQKKNRLKNGINISVNISQSKDSLKTTYLNLGLLTNIYNQQGLGVNALSSVVQTDMAGVQLAGLASISGRNASGLQFGGLTSLTGNNSNGVMLSGLMNATGHSANGLQISGLGNIAGNTQNGVAVSALMNVSGEKMNGVQLSGILNVSGGEAVGTQVAAISNVGADINGMQLSVISNIAAGKMKGLQFCGAVNIAVTTENAFQFAGLTNVCQGKLRGIQFAPGNYAGEISGAQIGLINLCGGKVKGVQVGIINHSKDTTARKIGLVNINPLTRIQLLLFGGNTSKLNAAVRFKNHRTYTLLGIGTHYLDLNDKFSGCVFYRTGLYYPLTKRFDISGDLGYFHIENFENENTDTPERMYSLQARINVEYRIQSKFALFASGGYGMTRYYDKNKFYEKKSIVEIGIILF